MKRLFLLALLLPAIAATQTPTPSRTVVVGASITLIWTAPTTNTDGSVITDPITYNIYNVSSSATTPIANGSGITTTSSVRANLALGEPCYTVTAVVDGIESSPSAPPYCVAVIAAPKVPSAPTGLTSQ